MTRSTSAVLGFTAAAAALGLTLVNPTGAASAATPAATAALFSSIRPPTPTHAPGAHPHRPLRPQQVRHTYTVRSGDSFWSIAKSHHVDWYNLAADNGLQMYSALDAGRVLVLPAKGEKAHAPMPLEPALAAFHGSGEVAFTTGAASSSAVASIGSSSFEQCVISRESGGDADVTNDGGYWGLFQFSPSTWSAYGGSSADFGRASAGEQEQVFGNAVAHGGASNWAPYDGC